MATIAAKAFKVYAAVRFHACVLSKMEETSLLTEQAVAQIRASSKALASLDERMRKLAETLPEYPVVMEMYGVGSRLGSQLMAEIGDVRFPFLIRSRGLRGR